MLRLYYTDITLQGIDKLPYSVFLPSNSLSDSLCLKRMSRTFKFNMKSYLFETLNVFFRRKEIEELRTLINSYTLHVIVLVLCKIFRI